MLSVERTFAIHADHRRQELLEAAQNYRRAEEARAKPPATVAVTRRRTGRTWPSFRARRAAAA